MQDVKTLKRWMVFKLAPRPNGHVDKSPLSVHGGFAKSNDPATWGTYEEARTYCLNNNDCALGFVLGKEVGLVVIDIDKARKTKEEPWPEWVEREVEELDSFTEESCSGLGVHVWLWGEIPANRNNQKAHVEAHDSNKMFVVSQGFADRCDEIKERDLTELFKRIDAGQIGPHYRKPVTAFGWDHAKFRDIMSGNFEKHFSSRSEAVASALCTLATKHKGNAEEMRTEFERSAMCELWGDKWDRLGDKEIDRAIQWWESKQKKQPIAELPTFKRPAVQRSARMYVLKPKNRFDGWFPTSSVSVIGGPSGGGKTSILLALLDAQKNGEAYLGHETNKLDYCILYADRQSDDNQETIERLGLEDAEMNIDCLPLCWDTEAVHWILQYIESLPKIPGVVVIEGGDMLPTDATDLQTVSVMIRRFQEIARHYGLAIILSVGAPKSTKEGRHTLLRDRIFGSQIWGRMASTIATMSIPGDDDGSGDERTLDVLHRNAGSEHFDLVFVNGRLVPKVADVEDDPLVIWAKQQKEFSFKEMVGHFAAVGISKSMCGNALKRWREKKLVTLEGSMYRWKKAHKFGQPSETPSEG